jgi:hypothetical protein
MIICPVCAAAVSSHHECTRRATHNSWPRYDPTPTDVLRPDKPHGASTTRPSLAKDDGACMQALWRPCGNRVEKPKAPPCVAWRYARDQMPRLRPQVSLPGLLLKRRRRRRLRGCAAARWKVYGLLRSGELDSFLVGRCRRVPASALAEMIQRLAVTVAVNQYLEPAAATTAEL